MTGSQPPNIGQLGVRQLAAGGWRHLCIVQRSAVQARGAAGLRAIRVGKTAERPSAGGRVAKSAPRPWHTVGSGAGRTWAGEVRTASRVGYLPRYQSLLAKDIN